MKQFIKAFTEKYPESAVILRHFQDATGTPPEWENLTKTNLIVFVRYMKKSWHRVQHEPTQRWLNPC